MRKAIIVLGSAITLVTLTGCGNEYRSDDDARNLIIQEVVIGGEAVTCVVYDDERYSQGGVSCDFS